GAELVLRRRLQARRGAADRLREGRRLPAAPVGVRGNRPVRRAFFSVQRGNRLVLPAGPSGLGVVLLPRRGGRARLTRAVPRPSPLPRQAPRPEDSRAGPPRAARGAAPARARLPGRARNGLPRM